MPAIKLAPHRGRLSQRGRHPDKRIPLSAFAGAVLLATGASAQQMSLPGSFAVNSNGAATYDIAIAVPTGTAGVVPSLKLSYSSQNGNGILGVGWTLSGLPSVSRCAQTMAQDGVRGTVTFAATDRFCLDGQRLIAINGAYGAEGTEYRTEIDSYSRIISHGTTGTGPTWFEVHTKAGQIMQFGNNDNTSHSLILAGNGTARNWALNQVSDTKGNYFTVTYVKTLAQINNVWTGEAYPSRIDYTGNGNTAPYNSVQFVYSPSIRPDIINVYQAGMLVRTTVLLTHIQTYAGSTQVSDYQISYQQSPSTRASEVTSITACAADGSCLPSTTLTWLTGDLVGTFTETTTSPAFGTNTFGTPSATNVPYLLSGDFDGDGKTDFAFIEDTRLFAVMNKGNGTFQTLETQNAFNGRCIGTTPVNGNLCSFNTYHSVAGDFNGDGLTDIALVNGNTSILTGLCTNSTVLVLLSKGDGTFTAPMAQNIAPCVSQGSLVYYYFSAGDFDGDGRTDFIFAGGFSGKELDVYLSKGDGTFTESVTANAFGGGSFEQPITGHYYFEVGDFNGDGKSDFTFLRTTTQWVFLSNGGTTFSETINTIPSVGEPWGSEVVPVVGDFNGDGKTDLGFAYQTTLYVLLSNGDGTVSANINQTAFGNSPIGTGNTLPYTVLGDFNGDGKTDFGFLSGSTLLIFLNRGDGTYFEQASTLCCSFGYPAGMGWYFMSGDYNGDGKTDFAFISGGTLWTFLAKGPPADLVGSIQTGLGATTWISYAPLTATNIHFKEIDNAKYPLQNIQPPLYVVYWVDAPNGIGGYYSSWYSYYGAKVDLNGRGFLGFHAINTLDVQTYVFRQTFYLQSVPTLGLSAFPCLGLTNTMVKQQLNPDGSIKQVLNFTSNTYTYSNNASVAQSCGTGVGAPSNTNAPYQVSVSQTMAESWDLDGSAIPMSTTTYQYDGYGNPTQIVTSTPDGFSKTTTNSYTNDTTNWFLGRLTNATVTSTTP